MSLSKISFLVCQHEKLSSQLQLNQKKPPEGSKSEGKPSEAGPAPAAAPVREGAEAKAPEADRTEDKTTGENMGQTVTLHQTSDDTVATLQVTLRV